MANVHKFTFNLFQEHTMVCWKQAPGCIVVDPAFYEESERMEFYDFLKAEGLRPEAILVTHAHADHIFGVRELQDFFGIPVYMNSAEMPNLAGTVSLSAKLGLRIPDAGFRSTDVSDGETIGAAGLSFKVITTPGHSPGGVCYLEENERIMFTGDTLFAGTIGRTDLLYGEYDDEIRSIMEKLIILPPDIRIFPGHGGDSTIGRERTHNPFLEPFNEPEEALDPDPEPVTISNGNV